MNTKTSRLKPSTYICAGGLTVLWGLFIFWAVSTPGVTLAGYIAAFISCTLFAVMCLRFVRPWMAFWQVEAELSTHYDAATGAEPGHIILKIFLSFLAVDIAVVSAAFLIWLSDGNTGSFADYLEFWTCTDSAHYLDIARDWYLSKGSIDRLVQLVFFPGYPLAIRAMNVLVGNYLYSGMLVSALAFAGSGCVFYKLLRLDFDADRSMRALKYLCIFPGAFFFAAPMSESLFMLFCLLCLYFARKGKWALGCLFGGLAAFTRSMGLILLVPVFFELVAQTVKNPEGAKSVRRFLSLLLIPAGFAAYCYINYIVSGDPFKFLQYQSEHWGQHTGFFFNTSAYQTENAISCFKSGNVVYLVGLWLPNIVCCFSSLGVMTAAAKELRPSYTAWFIAYYVVAIGATWLLSGPRYLTAIAALPMALSGLTKSRRMDMLATICCVALYLPYFWLFVMRWQVW